MIQAIQAAGYFFPDSVGGTEVYVGALARELRRFGCESEILAPAANLAAHAYEWQDFRVHRYPWDNAGNRRIISGERPHAGFDEFLALLDKAEPGIYHQHSWTGGCGHHHLRAAKERGFRCVTTVHVAGNVCLSGTMMRMGAKPCNGNIDEYDCSKCWAITRKRIPAAVAGPLTRLSRYAAHSRVPAADLLSRATAAFDWHRERFEWMERYSDRIVVVSQWLYDALKLNGIAHDKLSLCRQGVDEAPPDLLPRAQGAAGLRIGFLGRYDPAKGLHVLVKAMREISSSLPIELRIHGIANGPEEAAYARRIRDMAAGDSRIHFLPPVTRDAIWSALADFDVLAVPSQVFETGPLVVLEAAAAGTPVIGSNLGGIAELVGKVAGGELVAHDSPGAWTDAIERLCEMKTGGSGSSPATARTMRDVARETAMLYGKLVNAA